MMCRKCGQSIPKGADKCPNCGAPARADRPKRRNVSRAANVKLAAKIPFALIVLALLHIAQLVMWFVPVMRMDTEGTLTGNLSLFKMFRTFATGGTTGGTLLILVMVAVLLVTLCALYLAIAPLFQGGRGRRMRLITSKVACLSHAAVLGAIFGMYHAIGADQGYAPRLLAGGIVQFALTVLIFALTVFISYASKQKKIDR